MADGNIVLPVSATIIVELARRVRHQNRCPTGDASHGPYVSFTFMLKTNRRSTSHVEFAIRALLLRNQIMLVLGVTEEPPRNRLESGGRAATIVPDEHLD